MLRTTALLLAVGVAGAASGPDSAKDDKLEGTWIATSLVDKGQKVEGADLKLALALKGGKYTLKADGKVVDEGTYTSDASKDPKQLDTTSSGGENKGMIDRGIYELKGDVLKTAFDEVTAQKRPTSFDGSKYQVVEFKRGKE
jgi:uncharacterized protein (TIGR03067 family)